MPEDDRPPERIWLNDEELSAHFDSVKERRRSDGSSEEWEAVPQMEQNELTRSLKR